MAKYTTTIKTICESLNDTINDNGLPVGYDNIDSLINNARTYIFDFDYPLWSQTAEFIDDYPNYKAYFEKKILKRYYMREIGAETVSLFKLNLCNKLNEIMPYYNQLFKSELLTFPVFENIDMTMDGSRDDTGSEDNTRATTTESTETISTQTTNNGGFETTRTPNLTNDTTIKNLDTPQGTVNNLTDNGYLTNASKEHTTQTGSDTTNNTHNDDGSVETTSNSNTSTTDNYNASNSLNSVTNNTQKGKNSGETYSEMLIKYRDTFLNIEKDIIDDLNELFMLIY